MRRVSGSRAGEWTIHGEPRNYDIAEPIPFRLADLILEHHDLLEEVVAHAIPIRELCDIELELEVDRASIHLLVNVFELAELDGHSYFGNRMP
jgi:hypothetical protein